MNLHTHKSIHSEINDAKSQFDVWRLNKSNRSEAMPEHLWDVVASLIQKHPVTTIFSFLRLNKDQAIRFFTKTHLQKHEKTVPNIPMVEIKNPQNDMAPTTLKQKNDFQILIQHTKGHQLSVKADKDLTFDAITAFMRN